MDGDIADLRKLCELAEQYNAFIILDEAHSIGAYGPNLRGLAAELGLLSKIDIITGSLSKGLPGGSGGFVLCNKRAADALRFASSGYIFSGSLPPATLAALNKALDILLEDNSIGDKLFYNQAYLRKEFRNLGLNVPEGNTPIIPIIFNDDKLTYSLCRELHKKGVFVNPVRYPFVAKDAPRIRINATASLSEDDLKYSIEKFKEVLKDLEIASS
jgi:glycine C-acetyltransferase